MISSPAAVAAAGRLARYKSRATAATILKASSFATPPATQQTFLSTASSLPTHSTLSNQSRSSRSRRTPALDTPFAAPLQRANMGTESVAAASHKEFNRDSLFDMKGRVALVTGAGSGIGLMATQALAVNGAKVYIAGRTTEKLDNVVSTYGQDVAGEIIALQADVTSKADVQKLVDEISKREGHLSILVNNAGVSSASVTTESASADEMKKNLFDTDKTTVEDFTDVYKTNVAAMYFMTTAFLPLIQKSSELHEGWSGTVINITSISGLVKSAQHHFSYNASKAAAIHLTRMLAAEVAENGLKVRINSLAPGVFPSEMTTKEDSDEYQKSHIPKEKYAEKVPAARPGRDEDMAQTVLFFAANQYLNGQTVAVDGGYTLAAGL